MRSRQIQTELRRDLTEHQRAEDARVEEKERGRVTLSCIGDAVITTDTCGKVTYLNPVAEVITVGLPQMQMAVRSRRYFTSCAQTQMK